MKQSFRMATANISPENSLDTADSVDESSKGNERLQERLYPEANLRHRHGRGSDDSFDFVNVNNEMSTKQMNTADAKNSTTSDSSIYHQKTMLSDCDGNLTKEATQKSGDSGGAKPKIREQDTPTTSSNAYSSDSTNSDRLEASTSGVNTEQKSNDEESSANAAFECNICLDVARDAVISMCGHLFCWPCLHTWLETRPNRQICPVCKAGIGKDKVVPLYGRDDANPKDPRDKPVPPRPKGQRPEPESTGGSTFGGFGGFGGGGNGFQMSFGIGAFPFGFFATNFNMGDSGHTHVHGMRGHGAPEGSAQFEEEQFLHKVFLWVAFLFIFWLLVA